MYSVQRGDVEQRRRCDVKLKLHDVSSWKLFRERRGSLYGVPRWNVQRGVWGNVELELFELSRWNL